MKGLGVTGVNNFATGKNSLQKLTDGSGNVAIGPATLQELSSGVENIAIGNQTLNANTGDRNVAVGAAAGADCTGNQNLFLGYLAGAYQTTVSNKLIIDAWNRGSSLGENDNALIIGQFAATAPDQTVTLNAVLKLKPIAGAPSSPVEGMIYYDSTAHMLYCYGGSPLAWKALF